MKHLLHISGILSLPTLPVSAGPVEAWNAVFISAVQAEATPPCLVARNLAILHAAVHDAVNAADPQFEPYVKDGNDGARTPVRIGAASAVSPEAAAAMAAHTVAMALYPARAADFESVLSRQRAGFPSGEAAAKGQIGRASCRERV